MAAGRDDEEKGEDGHSMTVHTCEQFTQAKQPEAERRASVEHRVSEQDGPHFRVGGDANAHR
jgi:hypothetical protein